MSEKKPELKRDNTMLVTAKEGERYLQEVWNVQKPSEPGEESSSSINSPKLSKFTTMLKTKQEGETFVSALGGGLDEDMKTRHQQDQLDKILDEPMAKKAKLANEKSENKEKPAVKRVSTIVKTAQEGEELLKELGHKDDNPESDRRRTRSQTRGGPPPPPPTPKKEKKNTINKDSRNDGKSRGRGRPKKEEKRDNDKQEDHMEEEKEDKEEEEEEEEERVSKESNKDDEVDKIDENDEKKEEPPNKPAAVSTVPVITATDTEESTELKN